MEGNSFGIDFKAWVAVIVKGAKDKTVLVRL